MKSLLFRELRMLLRPLETKIANVVARAVIERVNDAGGLQSLQVGVLEDEPVEDAENFQAYGLTSKPTAGAEAVLLFPNGDRSHPLVIAVDDRRYRLTGLADGEVALYSEHGQTVHLKADGSVEVTGTEVRLAADDADDPVIRKSDLDQFISTYNGHTHQVATTGTAAAQSGTAAVVTGPGIQTALSGSTVVKVPS